MKQMMTPRASAMLTLPHRSATTGDTYWLMTEPSLEQDRFTLKAKASSLPYITTNINTLRRSAQAVGPWG